MAVVEVGRLAVKIAGRDAGRECLIVDVLDKNYVLIDGNTRRRKCNISHLEFLPKKANIKKGATHEEVINALTSLGVKILPRGEPKVLKAESVSEAKAEKKIAEKKSAEEKRAKSSKAKTQTKTQTKTQNTK